jgi:hypothetical protein
MRVQMDELLRQTMARITTTLANLLPGLLAFLVILLLTVIVAFILRSIIRRSLHRIEFDHHIEQWGFSAVNEWSPERSPSQLIAQTSFWAILLMGVPFAVSALDSRLTAELTVELFNYLPHVVAAVLILIAGSVASRFLARSVLISAVNMHIQSARMLSLGVKWLVIVLTVAMALDHLRIGGTVVQISFAILFGGIVLALALAIGLGSKDMVRQSWARQNHRMEREVEEPFHHM